MHSAAVTTLIAVGLIVLAVAAFLLAVIVMLVRIARTLARIDGALALVAERTAPIGPLVDAVNEDLDGVARRLELFAGDSVEDRAPA